MSAAKLSRILVFPRPCPLRPIVRPWIRIAVLIAVATPAIARGPFDLEEIRALLSGRNGAAQLYAIFPPNLFQHDVGLLTLQVTNIGAFGNDRNGNFSAGWRGAEYLFSAGIWVGAKGSDGIPHVSSGTDGATNDAEFLPPIDPEWTIYESFEGQLGGDRLGFSTSPRLQFADGVGDVRTSGANDDWNDATDFAIDEDFLNGLDDDGDGLIDEDFEAIGQQMLACQYWDISDVATRSYPEHEPLELLVQQRSFAWATADVNEFIGLDFKIWNIGDESLHDVFIAFFVDSDVGPKDNDAHYRDDKGGFVTVDSTIVDPAVENPDCRRRTVIADIAYMFDTPDILLSPDDFAGGDVDGYFGTIFLGHSTDPLGETAPSRVGIRRARFFSVGEPYPDGDPRNDIERYDLISGRGVPIRETVKPRDYRYVVSAGPFTELPPDTFLTFQTAFVIGSGRDGMIENAVRAQLIYDGTWRDADDHPGTGSEGKETCILPPPGQGSVVWEDPCDSMSVAFPAATHCTVAHYVDADCDICTPLASDDEPGRELLVHWVGPVAPAPPSTNTDCDVVGVEAPGGNRRVILQWNNLSEMKADPVRREVLFEGYRIWRVEGWRRPLGSTGPTPDEWQLIASFVQHPEAVPGTCWVSDPREAGHSIPITFALDTLDEWAPIDSAGLLPDDPCEACPHFCWPERGFRVNDTLVPIQSGIVTGDTRPGYETADLYPIGYYTFVDDVGIKNGMIYFYDVTAFSAWDEVEGTGDDMIVRHFELSSRPVARECQMVIPSWPAQDEIDEVYVVPNPYIQGNRTSQPWGWDLIPSNADPTGTRIGFTNLAEGNNVVRIYTLAGDLVERLDHRAEGEQGTVYWNLVSRNGQDVTAGVYIFSVENDRRGRQVGRFTIIR